MYVSTASRCSWLGPDLSFLILVTISLNSALSQPRTVEVILNALVIPILDQGPDKWARRRMVAPTEVNSSRRLRLY